MIEQNKIYNMDCLDGMRQMHPESVDLICTDAPYGLSFMGKHWDKATPSVEIWRECYRILKSGAFAFVMSSPRADVMCQMITRLQEAGFRTDFTPIYWCYASGFPKSMNISKSVDTKLGFKREIIRPASKKLISSPTCGFDLRASSEREAVSREAVSLNGSYAGFQPKPAVEVIIVAMKPLSEKTFVDQALTNGKGVTWLDKCRIPINLQVDASQLRTLNRSQKDENDGWGMNDNGSDTPHCIRPDGRFPANLLVSDNCLDNGKITKDINRIAHHKTNDFIESGFNPTDTICYGDERQFSRFFSLDAWWAEQIKKLPPQVQQTFPFLIVPKASNSERNNCLESLPIQEVQTHGKMNPITRTDIHGNIHNEGQKPAQRQNIHPTVKPLQLMCYLVTLGSRPNDIIVDPFIGSGTTAIACKVLNRNYIGFEKEKAYYEIAVERTRFTVHQALSQSIVENSAKFLTVENIDKAIQRHQKPNKIFGKYYA